jgi:hypothetical protein
MHTRQMISELLWPHRIACQKLLPLVYAGPFARGLASQQHLHCPCLSKLKGQAACAHQAVETYVTAYFVHVPTAPAARRQSSFIHRHDCGCSNGLAAKRTDRARQNFSHIHNAFGYAFSYPNAPPPNYTYRSHKPPVPQRTAHNRKRNKKIQKTHTKKP